MNPRHAGLLLVATAIALSGCSDRKLRPLNPCTVNGVVRKVSAGDIENVDLLMMVDNSNSMEDEQEKLENEFSEMVKILLTGHDDSGQIEDFPPVKSLRVGVITSDMGVLGVGVVTAPLSGTTSSGVLTCGQATNGPVDADKAFFGDDGEIQLTSEAIGDPPTIPENCETSYPTFLTFEEGGDTDAFGEDFACTAVRGVLGCGFEMQLESVLVAITDSEANPEISFAPTTADGASRNRTGRATPGESNAGFFREDSVKAIILVTDEEDCSTDNPEIFMFVPNETTLMDLDYDSNLTTGDPTKNGLRVNTRCLHFDEELYDIERYVDGLLNISPGDPNKVVFAAITGVPQGLEEATLDEILADPRMAYQDVYEDIDGVQTLIDPNQIVFTEPACWTCEGQDVTDWSDCVDSNPSTSANDALQWAAPGRRYVELANAAEEAGMHGVVRSICDSSFSGALSAITERIADVLRGACLPRALNPDATGQVNCDVVEIVPSDMTCADRASAGRNATALRTETINGEVREVCQVNQLVPTSDDIAAGAGPAGLGWYYDTYTEDMKNRCPASQQQRISFSVGAEPIGGSDIRLECLQPVQGGGLTGPDIFLACDPNATVDTSECSWIGDDATEEASEFIVRYNLNRDDFFNSDSTLAAQALFCESESLTCQIGCDSAAQCPGGFVCFDPTTDSAHCEDVSHACYCVNPTCSADSSSSDSTTIVSDAGI